ncbi:EGF-like domain-containing protein [Trichinella sp. T6]|nr:EGF-like domain-containing protein [Trichinella sp. T6]
MFIKYTSECNFYHPSMGCVHDTGIRLRRRRHDQSQNLGAPMHIDLNITVPFIFKPRLYPYGEGTGDNELSLWTSVQGYISKDGVIGFSPNFAESKPTAFPSGEKVLAIFWTPSSLGDIGKVYFRETTETAAFISPNKVLHNIQALPTL